jgi:lipid II:glycine glycyltransferase (peptidoglycan interpeptide bridge formation enzyme)
VTAWARQAGYDAVLADAEIPAATGYPALLAARGFRPAEEVGPSRHRVAARIAPGADDDALLAGIAKATSQRFLAAERRGMRVIRHDAAATGTPGVVGDALPPAQLGDALARAALDRFHALLKATGDRRGFVIGPHGTVVSWWLAALAAGHLVLLEARAADDTYLGAAIFYRHGERLSYAHSGDVVALRHVHPGAPPLLLWRALQLAASEGRTELDLGGVDVAGARTEPRPGDPVFGLFAFKRSFGGRWVEMTGAHERTLRAGRARAGLLLVRAGRSARRLGGRAREPR